MKFDAGVDWCTLFEIRNSSSERVCLQARNPGPAFYMFNPEELRQVFQLTREQVVRITILSSQLVQVNNIVYILMVFLKALFFGTLTSAITTYSGGTNFIGCERLIRGGFDGYYKFWRYYHGKVLSQSEVTDLYNDRDDTSTATGRDGTEQEGTNTVTTTVETTVNVQNDSVESYEYSSSTWNQVEIQYKALQ